MPPHQTVACQVSFRQDSSLTNRTAAAGCIGNQSESQGWWKPQDGVKHYQGDVQAALDFGYDGIKIGALPQPACTQARCVSRRVREQTRVGSSAT